MILAIDQGTTGTTCLVVDDELRIHGRGYRELSGNVQQAGRSRRRSCGRTGARKRAVANCPPS